MRFEVRFAAAAQEDLFGLFAFLLERAETVDELDRAQIAIEAITSATLHHLAQTPYSCRKIGNSSTRRELIIPFGATGYVAFFEIASVATLLVLAARHQREED